MLPKLVPFEEKVTLIMGSGIQFLDFGIAFEPRRAAPGEFGGQPGGRSLARLEYDERRDRFVHPAQPDVAAKVLSTVPVDASLRLLDGQWLPLPVLRFAPPNRYAEGPGNWARGRIVALAPGEDPDGHTHRVTIACDTRVHAPREGASYLAPTQDDVRAGAPFRLAHRADALRFFLDAPWVDEWLREVFRELAGKRLRLAGEDIDSESAALAHHAHYLNWLHMIASEARPPELKIVSNAPGDLYEPIPVDLVLDVGNSRTCGVLIETHPKESDGLRRRYELELRDLTVPHQVYAEPFESRLEFAQAQFGREQHSVASGRSDAFLWPTIARVGREAVRLSARRRGTEGSTGISSPKRYLWDEEPYEPGWRFNCAFHPGEEIEPLATAAPFTHLVNDLGQALHDLEPAERMPVFIPRYSRSSLMMFMLAEVLTQAITQINSPAQRLKQSHSNLPRHLRSVILTVPPSMPRPEREIFRNRMRQAVQLVWKSLGWQDPFAEVDDPAARPYPPFPKVHVDWDEATCGQVVYLFSEIQNNFSGRSDEFFSLMSRPDRGAQPDLRRGLRIASIDIGGGTTDLVITEYHLDNGQGSNVYIVPEQRFRDGFKVAGDDILLEVIQKFVVPWFADALKKTGVNDPQPLLSRLIGNEPVKVQEAVLRQQLALQVLSPIGLRLLKEYEKYDPLEPGSLGTFTFADLLAGHEAPTPDVIEFVNAAVRRQLGANATDFNILETPIAVNLRKMHEAFLGNRMNICKTLKALSEIVHCYQCDVLLLTGRPSRLPGIQALFRTLLPLPPDRIVPMHEYRTGFWYPFHRQGRVADPKTTAAVGAMLCVLGRGRLSNFFFRADALRAYSTVRYLGQMDDNQTIKNANVFYAGVDLDNPDYELGEQSFEMRGPMRLGFRQLPLERWPASPLYTLDFTDERPHGEADEPQAPRNSLRERMYRERLILQVRLKVERRGRGAAAERFGIAGVELVSPDGTAAVGASPRQLRLQLNTLASAGPGDSSYWLDSGSVYR
jgi:hypothetical protein